jgi:hypothetical protein
VPPRAARGGGAITFGFAPDRAPVLEDECEVGVEFDDEEEFVDPKIRRDGDALPGGPRRFSDALISLRANILVMSMMRSLTRRLCKATRMARVFWVIRSGNKTRLMEGIS